jgi:hypothetical protein
LPVGHDSEEIAAHPIELPALQGRGAPQRIM